MERTPWQAALSAYVVEQRRQRPTVPRDVLTSEQEWQCRIVGGDLISWLREGIDEIRRQRQFFAQTLRYSDPPTVVFLLDAAGLAAFDEILPQPPAQIIGLLAWEYARWTPDDPDPQMIGHIEIESRFELPSAGELPELSSEFGADLLPQLRLHRTGVRWGALAGSERTHVWRSHNGELELLRESWAEFVY